MSAATVSQCRLCGAGELRTVYSGPIRAGGAESGTVDGFRILGCRECGIEFLDPFPDNTAEYYSGKEYWEDHHGPLDVAKLHKKHGPEQRRWFYEVGAQNLRRMDLVDLGCGIGIFLDMAKGIAASTSGVEPAAHFQKHVESSGHKFVLQAQDLPADSADVVVSFDTLEHVADPSEFLEQARRVLRTGGQLYIGVPNQNDFLKKFVPEYLPFFYHLSHLFYFNESALSRLLNEAGFEDVQVGYVHKYDLTNMLVWARDRKGVGTPGSELFDRFTEDGFRSNLERQGIASHLLVRATK
jgi:2-polyprenyl-3-methyl-5-hydroxy-6-metoxy-1,4-benzoquinol methylase